MAVEPVKFLLVKRKFVAFTAFAINLQVLNLYNFFVLNSNKCVNLRIDKRLHSPILRKFRCYYDKKVL